MTDWTRFWWNMGICMFVLQSRSNEPRDLSKGHDTGPKISYFSAFSFPFNLNIKPKLKYPITLCNLQNWAEIHQSLYSQFFIGKLPVKDQDRIVLTLVNLTPDLKPVSGQSWPRDPIVNSWADQRFGVSGAPALNAWRGPGGYGGPLGFTPTRKDWDVEPWSTNQHILGCFVTGTRNLWILDARNRSPRNLGSTEFVLDLLVSGIQIVISHATCSIAQTRIWNGHRKPDQKVWIF